MSAYNAPSFIVTIYNPAYFASNTANLTQSQANALYLQKTTADTATALETFSSGISTNSLATTSAASTLDIASTSTGVINIGVLGGRSQTIHIGDGNSNVVGGAVHINNGTSTASNVQILNGAGSTGTITLGSTTSTLTVNSPITMGYSTLPSYSPGMIGYSYSGSFPATLPTTGSTLSSVTISTAGVYLFMFALQVNCTLNPTTFYLTASFSGLATGYSPMNTTNFTCQLTQYFTKTDNTTVTYNLTPTYSGGTGPFNVSNSFFRAIKIA
jgi:hypothetical protein